MKKPIEPGDFFLLPFAGARRDLLVKAIQRNPVSGQWYVSNERGSTSQVTLESCDRCPPSVVRRIIGAAALSSHQGKGEPG